MLATAWRNEACRCPGRRKRGTGSETGSCLKTLHAAWSTGGTSPDSHFTDEKIGTGVPEDQHLRGQRLHGNPDLPKGQEHALRGASLQGEGPRGPHLPRVSVQ